MIPILSNAQMRKADAAAVVHGVSSMTLMEAAGWQVARAVRLRFTPRRVSILCGPGNNGGDGFVAARTLQDWGWPVRVALSCGIDRLTGDAATAAARWTGPVEPLTPDMLRGDPLVIDALFGAGLSRPLDGLPKAVLEEAVDRALDIVAIDVPSGLDGDTGQVLGFAPPARLTVSFFRAKTGHLLLPGRVLVGELVIADIGIPERVLDEIAPACFVNEPGLWRTVLPRPGVMGNKYDRGHMLIACGAMTGAARLVALAARRSGAGLLTIAARPDALAPLMAAEPGNIVVADGEWERLLADRRRNVCVIGPGLGVGPGTCEMVRKALAAGKQCVLDADALTSFAGHAGDLWAMGGQPVLTPHDGEYARLFAPAGDRLHRARAAAAESGAVMLLKGGDTVVAAPDGRASITVNAPPELATGGTGDVLAGTIGGLLAQGMPAFEAASAAAWMQGEAARLHGPGLIAEDIAPLLADVLKPLMTP